MTTHPNLATALAAFQAEMPTITKSKRADVPTKTGGKYSYTYADLAGVTEAAMPVLSRHGLAFTTTPRSTTNGYELRGVLMHTSGEKVTGALPIRGGTPQEIGSSLTYMRRYLFGCLTGVVTEDDDDAAAAQKARGQGRSPKQAEAAPSQGPTRRMSRPTTTASSSSGITPDQMKALQASFTAAGIAARDTRLQYVAHLIGRDVESSKDLTKAEASRVIDALKTDADAADAAWVEPPPEDTP